jgi:hypothetical protein
MTLMLWRYKQHVDVVLRNAGLQALFLNTVQCIAPSAAADSCW